MAPKIPKFRHKGKKIVGDDEVSPVAMVENPSAWVGKASLPPRWSEFQSRIVIAERKFDFADIFNNAQAGDIQLPNLLEFVVEKHLAPYCLGNGAAYPSLTKLFYAGLRSNDFHLLEGSIGKFKFSFSQDDIVQLFDNDKSFTDNADPVLKNSFRSKIPIPDTLIQNFFIVPNRRPLALIKHIDILLFIIAHWNILPSKGNKSEITEKVLTFMHCVQNFKPCLAHFIYSNMHNVLGSRKNAILPYPRLITRLLVSKGYKLPDKTEPSMPLVVVNHITWERALSKAYQTRLDAFDHKKWDITVGMIVGGETFPADHPGLIPRKRRHIATPDVQTVSSTGTASSTDGSSTRIDTALATMTALINNMNLSMTEQLVRLESKIIETQTEMRDGFRVVRSDMSRIYQECLSWNEGNDIADTTGHLGEDDSDEESQPLNGGDDPIIPTQEVASSSHLLGENLAPIKGKA